jgi:hypothetical protein
MPYDREPQWDKAVLVVLGKSTVTRIDHYGRIHYWGLKSGYKEWERKHLHPSLRVQGVEYGIYEPPEI